MNPFSVKYDDSVLNVRVRSFDQRVKARLVQALRKLSIDLTTYVQTQKLSGQVLRNISGGLRSSIHPEGPWVTGHSVRAGVGTNLAYAGFHEYGFTGTETVRAHLRALKSGKTAQVKEHPRNVNYPEHSYLRSSLRDYAQRIRDTIGGAVIDEAKRR